MDSKDDHMPSSSGFPMQYVPSYHSGRRSLPPLGAVDPHHPLPSYPSSTLQQYYPSSNQLALYTHLPPHFPNPYFSQPAHDGVSGILPSISRSRVPSLRRTPSVPSPNLGNQRYDSSPHLVPSPNLDNQHHDASPLLITTLIVLLLQFPPVLIIVLLLLILLLPFLVTRFMILHAFLNISSPPPSLIYIHINQSRLLQHPNQLLFSLLINQLLYNLPHFLLVLYLLFLPMPLRLPFLFHLLIII